MIAIMQKFKVIVTSKRAFRHGKEDELQKVDHNCDSNPKSQRTAQRCFAPIFPSR